MSILLKKISNLLRSKLFKSGGIYTVASIIEKAIPFLLLPILTRYLSAEDYGIVSMFTVLVGLAMPMVGYNGYSGVLRNYFKDDIDIPVYIGNILYILFASSLVAGIGIYLFSELIATYSKFPKDWLGTVLLVAVGQFSINIILVNWQAQNKAIQYGAFKILLTLLNLGLAILLIVGMGYGWEGRVIGQFVAVSLFGILAIGILWHKGLIKFQIAYGYIKHALSYGVPLIPHVLSGFMITMIDRVFITNMVGISETGIYTVGYEIGMIISVLASSFNKAWVPWLFEKLNHINDEIKRKIVRFTYGYFILILCMSLALSFMAPWFMKFFVGEDFLSAASYVPWIAIAYSFQGMYLMVTNYIFYEEKTQLLAWMTFIAAGANIVLNYFLINAFGAIGAAQATFITFVLKFIIIWSMSSIVYPMPWFSAIKIRLNK